MINEEKRAYITLLVDALGRKRDLLRQILGQTEKQSELLSSSEMDRDAFEGLLRQKSEEIKELNEIDEGFDAIYRRMEQDLVIYKNECKSEILKMQKLITDITDCSASIQVLEKRNSTAFKLYVSAEKSSIREKKVSSQMASSYYKNMSGRQGNLESIFIDKKK